MTTAAVLGSGAPKVLVETSRDLPLVSVSVGVRTGALLDPDGGEGSTRLVARLLRRKSRIYEVPVSYSGRPASEGRKFAWRDGVRALGTLLRYRWGKLR